MLPPSTKPANQTQQLISHAKTFSNLLDEYRHLYCEHRELFNLLNPSLALPYKQKAFIYLEKHIKH